MSDDIASKILPIAGTLIGVVIGGLISAFSTWRIENQKWRRDRKEKLDVLRRDALAVALEWLEPMRNAETRASLLVMSAIQGTVDDEQFLNEFPYLLGDLVKQDLPGNLRAVLPNDAYARGYEIVRNIYNLRILGVKYGQEARRKGIPMVGFDECNAALATISKQIIALETDLQNAFRSTFE